MAWLRIDDGFTSHPKFAGWSADERWAFLELMSYCARYRTRGKVPEDSSLLPRKVGVRLLKKAEDSGWIERKNGARFIHDWDVYNPADPTAAERKRRQRDRDKTVTADRDNGVTVTPPRARARARVPVPSPRERDKSLSQDVTLTDEIESEIDEAARRQAWVDRAQQADVRSPSAFIRAGVHSGEWPDPFAEPEPEPRAVNGPVTVETCPECGCSPPYHEATCSRRSF
jgi:hypothetical protein